MKATGFAIALAWPETYCKQPGAWYDSIMNAIGISKNHYYKVGHAALVLVNNSSKECLYFDFGRYHSPFGHGRVRDLQTDHELIIQTKALLDSKNHLLNISEIIQELFHNEACHGSGKIYAATVPINFEKAYKKAKKLQEQSPINYGPFVWKGTNCSRFVRTIILHGATDFKRKIKLLLTLTITPTPMFNVTALKSPIHFYHA